ncbi:MAG: CotH kinase family protein [Verrucomicrobiales bacterium]
MVRHSGSRRRKAWSTATVSFGVKTNNTGAAPDTAAPGWWDGKLDDFGIWSRALSESEVALIYSRGLQGLGLGDPEPPGGDAVLINELMAADGGIAFPDDDGDNSDWVELYNPGLAPIDLAGWFLTDDPERLNQWMFPSVVNPPGGYLVVFASGKDRRIPSQRLHTNFRLASSGEFLALVRPDGVTISSGFDPQFPAQTAGTSYGFIGAPPQARPLAPPTPGAANRTPAGPRVEEVTRDPSPPWEDDQPLLITARVAPSGAAVSSVTLRNRIMFQPVVSTQMHDDASGGDAIAGDGVYSALIPAGASMPGEMVRWAVTATDADGLATRMPPFPDPRSSPEYFGTVVADGSIDTRLPVLHRFVETPSRAELRSGTRASVWYNGEFYDNIFIRQRGGTSAAWPKKSYKIDFNDGFHFRFRDGVPRVDEINLNTTYTDKSYLRSVLAYEHQRDAGQPSPEAFLIHCRQNAQFFSVAILVEQPDRDFLRRWNLDPDGALYKGATAPTHYEPSTPLSYWEKRTRREEGTQDLSALLAGLAQTGAALETFLFDQIDLPRQINYMATTATTQNIDGSDKNHFLYRDTQGSGEWFMLPWDLDLTFGPDALNTDTIVFNRDSPGAAPSHPYIGARPWVLAGGKYNHFLEVIVANPRTRAMLNRRIRTLADEFLAPPYFHERIDALVTEIAPDVVLDKARWGADAHFGTRDYTLVEAAERIKREYLDPRLGYLTLTQGVSGGGTVLVHEATAAASALVPRDGSLGLGWTDPAFDDTAWIHGLNGVGYERGIGGDYDPLLAIDLLDSAVPASHRIDTDGDNINENSSVYVRLPFLLPDPAAISSMQLKVKYDDGFIAYLNGTEIARRNAPVGAGWNASATGSHADSQALVFESIGVSGFRDRLRVGGNVLSIHALNDGPTGSDMLLVAALVDGLGVFL